MAVLGNIATMVAVGTFILFWAVQKGPAAVPVGTKRFTNTYKKKSIKNLDDNTVKTI